MRGVYIHYEILYMPVFNPLAPELFFLILTHPLYKM